MENFEKRNRDFYAVVCRLQREGCPGKRSLSIEAAIRRAINSEAPRFYITREHAFKRLRERRRHRIPPHEKPHRRQMWQELDGALRKRMEARPASDEWVVLDEVLATYRPSGFFITEAYAKRLVYKMMNKRINLDK